MISMELKQIKYKSVCPGQKFMVNNDGPYLMTEYITSYTTKFGRSKDRNIKSTIDQIIVHHAFHMESGRELDPYVFGYTWTSINDLTVDLIMNK